MHSKNNEDSKTTQNTGSNINYKMGAFAFSIVGIVSMGYALYHLSKAPDYREDDLILKYGVMEEVTKFVAQSEFSAPKMIHFSNASNDEKIIGLNNRIDSLNCIVQEEFQRIFNEKIREDIVNYSDSLSNLPEIKEYNRAIEYHVDRSMKGILVGGVAAVLALLAAYFSIKT